MKTWFAQFRISNAVDSGKPLLKSLRRKLAWSNELRQFQENATSLSQRLAQRPPSPEPPACLHGSIMRAINAAKREPARHCERFSPYWLTASATTAVLVMIIWWFSSAPKRDPGALATSKAPSLEAAGEVLGMSDGFARAVPVAVMAPLSDELDRLGRDFENAAQFLLASVP